MSGEHDHDREPGAPAVRTQTPPARARRERRRRVRRRRFALAGVVALIAVGVIALLASSGKSVRHPSASTAAAKAAGTSATPREPSSSTPGSGGGAPTASASTATQRATAQRAGPSPGSLPQTEAFPSANTRLFRSLMADLWSGVVHDSVTQALPAFFPEGAYVQLKSIGGAASDWTNRLVDDYRLDIGAAHALLGSVASSARLLGVHVVSSYGHWVPPGVCDNGIGYYELPNARVVYSEGGATRSFGIASLISWRGVWYVVHLGAILRSSETGEVDEPSSGPGVSAYSGTC